MGQQLFHLTSNFSSHLVIDKPFLKEVGLIILSLIFFFNARSNLSGLLLIRLRLFNLFASIRNKSAVARCCLIFV